MSDKTPTPAPSVAQQRLTAARDTALGHAEQLSALRTLDASKRGATYVDELRAATVQLTAADAEVSVYERLAQAEATSTLTESLAAFTAAATASRGPRGNAGRDADEAPQSWGHGITESEDYKKFVAGERNGVEYRAHTLVDTVTVAPMLPKATPFFPSQALVRRRLFVRDLLAGGQTTLASVPYMQEVNSETNILGNGTTTGVGTVAEGALKPETSLALTQQDAVVRKIATWIPVTMEALQDAPTLRSYIDARLAYGLRLREEIQLLNGNGTAPNLRGITQTTGVQTLTVPGTGSTLIGDYISTVGRAISMIEAVDGYPDGVVMHPTDFWTLQLRRRTTDGAFDTDPFGSPVDRAWGVQVVRSRTMTPFAAVAGAANDVVGKALVGDFGMGAQIFDRESPVIRLGDQHADYFTSNKLVVLAEERLTLAVYRPDWFVLADLRGAADS